MSNATQTIHVKNDARFGPVIKCLDPNEADLLEDFLTAKDISDFWVRFSESCVELFVPTASFEHVVDLVKEFRDQSVNLQAKSDE